MVKKKGPKTLTLSEAFSDFLQSEKAKQYLTNTVGSWRHRHKNGKMDEDTMRSLLKDNGYKLVQEEMWS